MPEPENATRRQREQLRRCFRPDGVRLLFVGESPPASGRFFYRADSGLYRAMREAFLTADPALAGANFLTEFRSSGCYLIDLCPEPVDHLPAKLRTSACLRSEPALAQSIAGLRPRMIATVVRSIETNVLEAARRAGWHGPLLHLPYPGRWSRHRDEFVRTLVPVIRALPK